MNITLVISSLKCGGAERVMSNMANYWSQKGYEVYIVKFDNSLDEPFYNLSNRINVTSLDLYKVSHNLFYSIINTFYRINKIRKAIVKTKPDVVISFIDIVNIFSIISLLGTGIPIIISERVNPKFHNIGAKWDHLRRFIYPLASKIVIQTDDIMDYFNKVRKKCIVISNPVKEPGSYIKNPRPEIHRRIIAIGRLNYQKGFDLLIKAFKIVSISHDDWVLCIFGEGSERGSLEYLINELSLKDKVILSGITDTPYDEIIKSDIFILSSRYEGFPNALCEAMACGMPVISTDCPSGPSSIIKDGYNGILVPSENIEALAAAMIDLIVNERKRNDLAKNATNILDIYSEDAIMTKWEDVIRKVCS